MGNKPVRETTLEKWKKHISNKSDQWMKQEEFDLYDPKQWITHALAVANELEQTQKMNSYLSELKLYLQRVDPNRYVNQLAVFVYLDYHNNEFNIPQSQNKREQVVYKLISRQDMFKDILEEWGKIFQNKYDELSNNQSLRTNIETSEYFLNSVVEDVNQFINYIIELATAIYRVESNLQLRQLVIKLILSKKRIKELIDRYFSICNSSQTELYKSKLEALANKSLQDIEPKIPDQLCISYTNTITLLNTIPKLSNPGDQFDLFNQLDSNLKKDLEEVNIKFTIDVDLSLGIVIYLLIKSGSTKWVQLLSCMEKLLGNGIGYDQEYDSWGLSKVKMAIEFILTRIET